MKKYRLDFGWEAEFPEDWTHEVDEKGVSIFYPPNDSTTAYATVFTADKQGVPAPAEILEDFFVKSLVNCNAEEIPLDVDGLGCRAFFCVDDKGIYRISAGIFTEGNLLSLNVYSESKDKVFETADWFCRVRFNGG